MESCEALTPDEHLRRFGEALEQERLAFGKQCEAIELQRKALEMRRERWEKQKAAWPGSLLKS